jgi:hypothetical protein
LCGCKKDTSPLDAPEIALTVANVGVTEAWLHLELKSPSTENQITVMRNDSIIRQINNLHEDSLIYDENLLPGQSYTYRADYQSTYQLLHIEKSLTTLDTTNHDFNWEILTFGEGGSSTLYDVCIINENDIWAVGEIWLRDSTGEFINPPFNTLHWNGEKWLLERILIETPNGSNYSVLRSIFSFDTEEILTTPGLTYMLKNENGWSYHSRCPITTFKIWGKSSNRFYAAGLNGGVAHSLDKKWQQVETGTELPVQDIWGSIDEHTQEEKVLCVASEKFYPSGIKILYIKSVQAIIEQDYPFDDQLHTVWFNTPDIFFVAGDAVYRYAYNHWIKYDSLPHKFINRIRGNDYNDLFICGDFGLISHFNGITWREFKEADLSAGLYHSQDFKGNIMVAVGQYDNQKAVLAIGRR